MGYHGNVKEQFHFQPKVGFHYKEDKKYCLVKMKRKKKSKKVKRKMPVKKQKTEEISDERSDEESPSPEKPKCLKKKKRASPPPPEALSSPAEVAGL